MAAGDGQAKPTATQRLFVVAAALWALSLLFASIGWLLSAEVLVAFGFPLLRLALGVTVAWAVVAVGAALWRWLRRR